ncbi:glutamate N-acetyltransferase [Panacagrimonas perspica]|uniref:Arginine biosynthesis bifunctional protein ArgJ n=1 Tax=Panacagrimonas perspica TaxID=381431 RepID=A0A4S3JZ53_9GAMM|nr:bifunctional glutamate N-acetyltransferase/amino-acid acetyltransferase ArgJ [Panacagrimonas perspica]TDU28469.1 glutamate N-acetyltransferase [Panacagrimonas perspica]THD00869.1 bifunctional ornithine acetyltransferase/N-acetylglutamate synthase [Panacagrimonas perspica]
MAVNLSVPDVLHPVPGVRLGVAEAAIKKPGRKDLLVIALDPGARVAGIFTRNAFCAPPVQVCRERLAAAHEIRALVINSGNANAATGQGGIDDARLTAAAVARALDAAPESVLPFSTGVIGQRLPIDRMTAAAPQAVKAATSAGWLDAMRAIMTTDTVPKGATRKLRTSQGEITVTGIAKGVGMICPDMATMLAFIATDARLTPAATQRALVNAAGQSFNCVTVDGDTSTNDSCVLVASGKTGSVEIDEQHADYPLVLGAITEVCVQLAQAVVRDGEGATKFISIEVGGAKTEAEARQVAYSVAHSPLVKTAMFASDANWGRIAMAIGKAGVEGLDQGSVSIALDDVQLIERGQPHPSYREELGSAVVAKEEFSIRIGLGRGTAAARVWTCDFSYDYVKINAEYRT